MISLIGKSCTAQKFLKNENQEKSNLLANVHRWSPCVHCKLFEADALSFAQTEQLIGCVFGGSIDLISVNRWHNVLFPVSGGGSASYATMLKPLLLESEPFMPRVGEVKRDPGDFPQGEGLFGAREQGKEKGLCKQCEASPADNERLTVMDSGAFSSLHVNVLQICCRVKRYSSTGSTYRC